MKTSSYVDDQSEFADAKAALAAFRRMAPQLTLYARGLTKNKRVRVMPGQNSLTDGETIYIRPPLSLAHPKKHEYYACERYDEAGMSECEACRSRESLMTAVHHEIAHIAFGSFSELTFYATNSAVTDVATKLGRVAQEKAYDVCVKVPDKIKSMVHYVNLLGDAHLSTAYLFAEDLRINEASYRKNPGQRKQAFAFEKSIIENGIEREDGTMQMWSENPLDIQLCAGVYFAATGQNLAGHLDDEVLEVLADRKVKAYLVQFVTVNDVYETFITTVKLVHRLRELGFMQEPEEEDEDEGDDQESGENGGEGSEGSEGSSSGAGDGSSDSSGGDKEESDSSGDQESDGDGGDEDSEGGESDVQGEGGGDHQRGGEKSSSPAKGATAEQLEQLVRYLLGHAEDAKAHEQDEHGDAGEGMDSAMQQQAEKLLDKVIGSAWVLDRVPRNIEGVHEHKRGEGQAWNGGYYGTDWARGALEPTPEGVIGKSVMQARIAFSNNHRVEHHRNQKSGRIATNVLGKRAALGDPRLFGRKIMPDARSYHVLLGLDISYSTAGANIVYIKQAVHALADVCARVGVSFSIYAHSTVDVNNGYGVGIWKVKSENDKWDAATHKALASLAPVSGNLDGHTMQYYRKQLDAVDATDKVLMYFTDGKMPATNYDEELFVLQSEIEMCRKKHYTLLGVGIGTDSPKSHGLDTVRVDSSADYPKVVQHLSKQLIRTGR